MIYVYIYSWRITLGKEKGVCIISFCMTLWWLLQIHIPPSPPLRALPMRRWWVLFGAWSRSTNQSPPCHTYDPFVSDKHETILLRIWGKKRGFDAAEIGFDINKTRIMGIIGTVSIMSLSRRSSVFRWMLVVVGLPGGCLAVCLSSVNRVVEEIRETDLCVMSVDYRYTFPRLIK